jgi:phosphoribosylformimino-5-aminoimidazole carboxamide ribotide isomerase
MIELIPAIDIIGGKCVRLSQGDYNAKTEYNASPVDMALQYEDAGIKRLHIVDLDGAKARRIINWKTLEQVASKTALSIDFGGGINTEKDCEIVFDAGAVIATLGSVAVRDEAPVKSWIQRFGAKKIWIGADVKNKYIATHGWTQSSDLSLDDFISKFTVTNYNTFFCTDVSKDGMMQGPSIDLYLQTLNQHQGLQLTASGGVRNMTDIEQLENIGCSGVIIGKAIYEGKISMTDLTQFQLGKKN